MKCLFTIFFVLACLALPLGAQEKVSREPDALYRKEIARLKRRMGKEFTVRQVGMFVAAWDLDDKTAAAYEKLMGEIEEALYEQFLVNRPAEVVRVVLFKDNASLRENAKKAAEKSVVMPAGGFYMVYEHTLCAEITMGPWLVRHELTHALVHADFGKNKPAPWFDEGMAMLVESARIEEKKFVFRADGRLAWMASLKKSGKLPALKDVLAMDFRTYNAGTTRAVADTLSRGLLLYLSEKDMLEKFYKRYRATCRKDPTGAQALKDVLQKDPDDIEVDLFAWAEEKLKPRAPAPAEKDDKDAPE